jgi:hypothetical protein
MTPQLLSKSPPVLDTVISLTRPVGYEATEGARFEVRFTKSRGFWSPDAEPFEARFADGQWSTSEIIADDSDATLAALQAVRYDGVLALAMKRIALPHGTVPSAVPWDRLSTAGQTGQKGRLGQLGHLGQSQRLPLTANLFDTVAMKTAVALLKAKRDEIGRTAIGEHVGRGRRKFGGT